MGSWGLSKCIQSPTYLHTPVYSKLFKYSITCCDPIIVGLKEEPSFFLMIQLFEHNINQSLVSFEVDNTVPGSFSIYDIIIHSEFVRRKGTI